MLIQGVFDYYTFRAFSCERKDGSLNQINSVFVIGESRTNSDNAITKNYGTFYMAFEVDDLTSEVLDFSCTHTISTTEAFLRKLFVGQVFPEIDVWLENTLNRRYGVPPGRTCRLPRCAQALAVNDGQAGKRNLITHNCIWLLRSRLP